MDTELDEIVKVDISNNEDKPKWKKMRVKCNLKNLTLHEPLGELRPPILFVDLSNCLLFSDKVANLISLKDKPTDKMIKFRIMPKAFNQWQDYMTRYTHPKRSAASGRESDSEVLDMLSFLSKVPLKKAQSPNTSKSPLINNSDPVLSQSSPKTSKSKNLNKTNSKVDEGKERTKQTRMRKTSNSTTQSKSKKIQYFGGDILEIYEKNGNTFPNILKQLIERIEALGINIQGIYRESGNTNDINKLKSFINEGTQPDFYNNPFDDPHVLSGTLKCFFRELKHKLIPRTILDSFLNSSETERRNKLFSALSDLPLPNRSVLYVILQHLLRISSQRENNKMDNKNIGIVFGPTLVESESLFMCSTQPLIQMILDDCEILFSDEKFMNGVLASTIDNKEQVQITEKRPLKSAGKGCDSTKSSMDSFRGMPKSPLIDELKGINMLKRMSRSSDYSEDQFDYVPNRMKGSAITETSMLKVSNSDNNSQRSHAMSSSDSHGMLTSNMLSVTKRNGSSTKPKELRITSSPINVDLKELQLEFRKRFQKE